MSPARRRVLEAVRAAGRPVGVDEIAIAVGLGGNAVRHHLAAMEADGLVLAGIDRAGARGRPRRVFTPGPGPGGPFERLALALLHARRSGAPLEAAGRAVAPPGDGVVAFLAADGFDPRPAGDGVVVLAACPLAHGLEVDPSAVCTVHRGLVAAIADREGQPARLVPGTPGTCRVILTGRGDAPPG
jgi:predicted ArsR family transcriptional regulator